MKNILKLIAVFGFLFIAVACEKDEPQELTEQDSNLVEQANKILNGETLVLHTRAKIGSTDKTLLKKGCPTRFTFTWNEETQKLKLKLEKFQVGNMPFAVAFVAECTYSELSGWDKDLYPEKGWVKFYSAEGHTQAYGAPEGEADFTKAGVVEGFVNPLTEEILFHINYNVLLVNTFTYRQKIDKTLLETFEKDFRQYEKDLKKYKKEHGLD